MIDDGIGEITIDHLASGKYRITAGDFIEPAVFKKTEIKETCHESAMGEIEITKSAPGHIGRGEVFGWYGEIFKFSTR